LVYGDLTVRSGPTAVSASQKGKNIAIVFKDVDGKLSSYSGMPTSFELCGRTQASCRFVSARLARDHILLPNEKRATRVRYCWGDSPVCSVTDRTRLPVAPFELPIGRERR